MRPLPDLVHDAIVAAQDDQAWFTDEEEAELQELVKWLLERRITSVEDLK